MIELVKFHELKSNQTGVEFPFVGDAKDEIKKRVPSARWTDVRTKDGLVRMWVFNDVSRPDVDEVIAKYFPHPDEMGTWRFTFDLDADRNLEIDGTGLFNVSRDWFSWKKNCVYKFRVIDQDKLRTGGSRLSPNISGRVTIELQVRDEVDLWPEPVETELIKLPENKIREDAPKPERREDDAELTQNDSIGDRYNKYCEKYGEKNAPLAMIRWLGLAINSQTEEFQMFRNQLMEMVAEREVAVFFEPEETKQEEYSFQTERIDQAVREFSFAYNWATSDQVSAEEE